MNKLLLVIAFWVTFLTNAFSQTPQSIPYQAVARNASGNLLVNQAISLRFTIHDVSGSGTVLYQETQSATTNKLGLFSVNIGTGTVVTGTFSSIPWSNANPKYTQVEIDPAGGSSYTNMGAAQMMSVPYALYAASAGAAGGNAGGDLTGTYPNPNLAAVGTAGTYGSSSTYPVVTVDSKGRVTAVTTDPLPTALPPSGTASGDLTGTYPGPTVAGIEGKPIVLSSLSTGNMLQYNGTNWVNVTSAGAANGAFILNQSAQQSGANFNISGNGTVGGTLAVTGAETVTGLTTASGGLTETGAASINTTGSAATNIGTSTNTGNVSIGNTTGGVNVKSLTTAGVVSTSAAGLLSTATLSGLTFSGNTLSTNNNGTVTSITAGTGLTGGTITGSGTIGLSTPVSVANGGSGLSTTPANGQLLIGNGTNYTLGTITGGTNITVTNSAGGISIAAAGSGFSGSGTTNYLARWTSASALGTGATYDNGTNVGIGTTTPNDYLEVVGGIMCSSAAANADIQINSAQRSTIYPSGNHTPTNLALQVRSAGTGILQLNNDNTGNISMVAGGGLVGIGSITPSYLLDVAGSGRFNAGGSTYVYVGNGGGAYYGDATNMVVHMPTGGNFYMANVGIDGTRVAQTDGSMRVGGPGQTASNLYVYGKEGIGTLSPAYLLDINNPASAQANIGLTTGSSTQGSTSLTNIQLNDWWAGSKYTSEINFDFYGAYYANSSHGMNFKSGRSGFDNFWFRNASGSIMGGFVNTGYGTPSLVTTDNFVVGGNFVVGDATNNTNPYILPAASGVAARIGTSGTPFQDIFNNYSYVKNWVAIGKNFGGSASAALDAEGNTNGSGTVTGANGYIGYFYNGGTSGSGGLLINLANGTTNSDRYIEFESNGTEEGCLYGGGGGNSSGSSFYQGSDRRLKKNIRPTVMGLNSVMQMKVRDYEWKDDGTLPITGFIAQELYDVMPQVVLKGSEGELDRRAGGTWMVNYAGLTPVLARAIQEQQAEIEALKTENAQLKTGKVDASDVQQLKTQNTEMQKQLDELWSLMLKNGIKSER